MPEPSSRTDSTRSSRRAFVAALAAAVGGATTATSVSADDHLEAYREAQPEHVSLTFPRSEVERYRPMLRYPSDTEVRANAIYAWKASSPEYDYDVYCYIVYYQTQRGLADKDSHRFDREPVQVYVHKDFREVREVVYSSGHWSAYRNRSPATYEPDDDDGEHVQLRVIAPWNHYVETTQTGTLGIDVEPLGTGETLFDADSDTTQYEVFLQNNWSEALHPGAFQDPDQMRFRDHYWRESRTTWSDRIGVSLWTGLAPILPDRVLSDEIRESDWR